jgi:signal transduction histidine kinase
VRVAPTGSTVTVANGQERGWAWAAVRDDGPGIPVDDQDRVFDRFWRGPQNPGSPSRTGDRGTGLGLAIVRQIAESHGGSIALHSRAGEGSTFVLWLPERPGSDRPRATAAPAGNPLVLHASR